MLNFLRKLRSNEMKSGRYLKYALGEIFLVMIGILLALAINNLNEDRKNHLREEQILTNLLSEVESNVQALDATMSKNLENKLSAEKLSAHTSPKSQGLSESEFAKLFGAAFKHEISYTPSTGVLNELVNTGDLSLISSQLLRTKLSSWEAELETLNHQEQQLEKSRQRIYELMLSAGNFRKMLDVTREDEPWYTVRDGDFTGSSLQLLRKPEFENNLILFIGASAYLDFAFYQEHKKQLKNLQGLISSELNQ